MFEEFQNGTNTVMNIKCDFVGCKNQDSVFCSTREKANDTLFERGWVIDSRKWKHFCKDHAAQHSAHPTGLCACPIFKPSAFSESLICRNCGKPPRG